MRIVNPFSQLSEYRNNWLHPAKRMNTIGQCCLAERRGRDVLEDDLNILIENGDIII